MPVRVDFFLDEKGRSPVQEWLEELRRNDEKGWKMCVDRFRDLSAEGHTLRRPKMENLGEKVYELRSWSRHAHYRVLFCFNGREAAVVTHAIVKNAEEVPDRDMQEAKRRMSLYLANPEQHSHNRAAAREQQPDQQTNRNLDREKGKDHGKDKGRERDN